MILKKYYVKLDKNERAQLESMLQKGNASGFKLRHAAILLKLDETEENEDWTQKKIAQAYGSTERTIINIAKRFVEEGLESALKRKPQQNRARKIDGDAEAKITQNNSTPHCEEGHAVILGYPIWPATNS